jgi:hypothetical protein
LGHSSRRAHRCGRAVPRSDDCEPDEIEELLSLGLAIEADPDDATFGSPAHAADRLRMAQTALRNAGYPNTPIAMGAAKSLLGFNPPAAGIPRFNDFMQRLQQTFGQSEVLFKFAARLMPAGGQPAEVMKRVTAAALLLSQMPSSISRVSDYCGCAVALGAMAKTLESMPELVKRFREVEQHLVQGNISAAANVEADALECIGCPGSPAEVVDTMSVLIEQLAQGRQPVRGDVAIAAAFAKRFAY